jgi:hypothetical protein
MIMLFSPPPVRICEHLSAPGEARALHEPLEEKDPVLRAQSNDAPRKTAADPAAHRAYLLRASLIDRVRKRAAAAA